MAETTTAATAAAPSAMSQALIDKYEKRKREYNELQTAIRKLGPAPPHEIQGVHDTAQAWFTETPASPAFVKHFVLGAWVYKEGHQGVFDGITNRKVDQNDMDQAMFFATELPKLVAAVAGKGRGRRTFSKQMDIDLQQKLHKRWKVKQKQLRKQRAAAAPEARTTKKKSS